MRVAEQPVLPLPLAGLVPALHEIVVHVGCARTGNLKVGVVVLRRSIRGDVAARAESRWPHVHAADEGDLAVMAGIDDPALLMME